MDTIKALEYIVKVYGLSVAGVITTAIIAGIYVGLLR